jgi:hypothetical protein
MMLIAARSSPLRWTLAAGLDRRERNASPSLIDVDNPNLEHVADTDHLVRIADVAIGQPADVDQTAFSQTEIDECAKVDHVQHRAT